MLSFATKSKSQKWISFLTDDKGEKKAVVFDLGFKSIQELMEDFFDSMEAIKRMNEPRRNFKDVQKRILSRKQTALHAK